MLGGGRWHHAFAANWQHPLVHPPACLPAARPCRHHWQGFCRRTFSLLHLVRQSLFFCLCVCVCVCILQARLLQELPSLAELPGENVRTAAAQLSAFVPCSILEATQQAATADCSLNGDAGSDADVVMVERGHPGSGASTESLEAMPAGGCWRCCSAGPVGSAIRFPLHTPQALPCSGSWGRPVHLCWPPPPPRVRHLQASRIAGPRCCRRGSPAGGAVQRPGAAAGGGGLSGWPGCKGGCCLGLAPCALA